MIELASGHGLLASNTLSALVESTGVCYSEAQLIIS